MFIILWWGTLLKKPATTIIRVSVYDIWNWLSLFLTFNCWYDRLHFLTVANSNPKSIVTAIKIFHATWSSLQQLLDACTCDHNFIGTGSWYYKSCNHTISLFVGEWKELLWYKCLQLLIHVYTYLIHTYMRVTSSLISEFIS